MSDLLPQLALVRWMHLCPAVVLFGATLYPRWAPTGRFLDRPLRIAVRIAAFAALATALAETGLAAEGLPRLALLSFACAVGISLRRNSWTVRVQASVLAAAAALALASLPLIGSAQPASIWRSGLEAAALIAAGAWLGALVPLALLSARAGADAQAAATALAAHRRFFVVAAGAVVILLAAGASQTFIRPAPPTPVSVRILQLVTLAALAAMAALDRFALAPRLTRDRTATGALATSIRLQGVLAFALLGTIALAWALAAVRLRS